MTMVGDKAGLTVDQVQSICDDFMASYNGHIDVSCIIRSTQEEIYGAPAEGEPSYQIQAAYHARSCVFTLVASHVDNEEELRQAIRHELLGHYGLNTFTPVEKLRLLDQVLQTRQESSLRRFWDCVDTEYDDKSDLVRAEEVFAFVAEEERSFFSDSWTRVRSALTQTLRKAGLVTGPMAQHELRVIAMDIADGIRAGHRVQQTFPDNDNTQFPSSQSIEDMRAQIQAEASPGEQRSPHDIRSVISRLREQMGSGKPPEPKPR